MAETGLSISGVVWEALLRIEQRAPDVVVPTLVHGMELLVDGILEHMPPYPPQNPQVYKPSLYWTPKQRAYFFWALREGIIQVPYKRKHSAGIAGAISGKVWVEGDTVHGAVGINQSFGEAADPDITGGARSGGSGGRGYAPYAPYVVGDDDDQAFYHKGNWWQFDPTVDELAQRFTQPALSKAINELVNGLLGGA